MEKLFTVAGTSSLEGVVKFRVANGSAAARTKVLERSGHTEIKLVDLATPMTKEAAIAFVQSNGFATVTVAAKPAKEPKAAKPAKLSVVPKSKPAKAAATVAAKPEATATKPDVRAQNMDEIARIKASNLETMRRVSNKLRALREF